MADQQLFWFQGTNINNGERIENLTAAEMMDLKKQDDAIDKEKAAKAEQQAQEANVNARSAQMINPAISNFAKQTGSAEQLGYSKEEIPASFKQQNPILAALDSVKENKTAGNAKLESMLTGQTEQPPAAGPASAAAQSSITQPKGASTALLEGLPEDLVADLVRDYRAGKIKPPQFLDSVKAMRKTMADIRFESEKLDRASDRTMTEKSAAQEAEGKNDIAGRNVTGGYAVKVAQINAAAEQKAQETRNQYSERTKMLKAPQFETLMNINSSLQKLDAVSNLFDQGYTGVFRGRVGDLIHKTGALSPQEAELKSALSFYNNQLIKLQSGANVTKSEYPRLAQQLTDTKVGSKQFKAIINLHKNFLINDRTAALDTWDRGGMNVAGFDDWRQPIESYSQYAKARNDEVSSSTHIQGDMNTGTENANAKPGLKTDDDLINELLGGSK